MATLHTCTVGVGGGYDYTSLSAAEAANFGAGGADLVALDKYVVVNCYPGTGPDTTACTVSGIVTDATHYITIQAAEGYGHAGVWSTSAYRLSITNAYALSINIPHVTLIGLQVDLILTGTTGSKTAITTSQDDVHVYWAIVRRTGGGTGGSAFGIMLNDSSSAVVQSANGCIVYGFDIFADRCISAAGTGLKNIRNCTGVSFAGAAFYRSGGTAAYTNCIGVTSSGSCWIGVGSGSSTNNISTDATAPAYGAYTRNATVSFVDSANGDFHIASANAFPGADLSSYFTTDIDAQTITTWSAGADAQAGAVGGSGVTGTASITLDDATASGAGLVEVQGSASISLDDATLAASGSVVSPATASAAITLDDATLAGSVTVTTPVTGAAAIVLEDATASGFGGAEVPAAHGSGVEFFPVAHPFQFSPKALPVELTANALPLSFAPVARPLNFVPIARPVVLEA